MIGLRRSRTMTCTLYAHIYSSCTLLMLILSAASVVMIATHLSFSNLSGIPHTDTIYRTKNADAGGGVVTLTQVRVSQISVDSLKVHRRSCRKQQ